MKFESKLNINEEDHVNMIDITTLTALGIEEMTAISQEVTEIMIEIMTVVDGVITDMKMARDMMKKGDMMTIDVIAI